MCTQSMRKTKQREAIRRALLRAERPLSPEELLTEAQRSVETLSLATVYRPLRSLEESGFLRPVAIPDRAPRYERSGREHHHHFCCRSCDRVFDVPGCPGNVEEIAPDGFDVDGHEVVLYGRCDSCCC